MAGIAGWVDYERDLSCWRPTVQAMTATMACRGPDGEGLWLDKNVAIGHRHLAVTAADQERQPFQHAGLAVVFDGALQDTAGLRAELALDARLAGGDAELVARAYQRWGDECPGHLGGTFAFAVWDGHRAELLLARDRLGLAPLFYYPTPHGVLFGSEPKAILAHPLAEAVLDAEGLCELLTYAGTPDHAVFAGMRKVRAAHTLRVSRHGAVPRRYWQLSAHGHADDLERTVRTVRELLVDSVARTIDVAAPTAAMLSGGLDSSAVVGLMKAAAPGSAPLTYTVTFANYARQFVPDQFRSTLDAPYVADVVARAGADHHDVVLGTAELTDPVARAAVIRAKDLPSMVGDMNTSAYLLSKAIRQDTAVSISGETADSVFSGNVYSGNTGADEMRLFPWMRLRYSRTGSLAMGGRLLSDDLLKRLDLFGYAAGRYQESCAETPLSDQDSPDERRARQDTYLQLTRWADSQLAHSERLSLAAGVQVRMPFTDHRLIDYVFNVPPAMKGFDGREKSLLRAAVSDVIPESVLQRRKSPFPVAVDPAYQAALSRQLTAIAADDGAPAASLLSMPAIHERLAEWSGTDAHWVSRTDAEFLISLNTWLREYGVRVAL